MARGDFAGNVTADGTGISPDPRLIIPALKTLYVGGRVTNSTIRLGSGAGTTGNVGSVSVGGFENSRLFAGYDEGSAAFNLRSTLGTFTVRGIRNTAAGFDNSFVYAFNFRNVLLVRSDTDNGGTGFGFTFGGTFGCLTLVNAPAVKKTFKAIGGNLTVDGYLLVQKV